MVHYTNASVIIPESFKDTEELGGTFSGWDPEKKQYDTTSWLYQGVQNASHSSDQQPNEMSGGHSMHGVDSSTDLSIYEQDLTLQHPRCVYQIMKRHFARYTPEMVERYCGIAKEAFLNVANLYCGASGPEKTAAICYALGWTQHSSGVQMIRCAAILQLLLGNMGRPGGGILALRGHASIQGSTDIPTLFDSLPGYLSMPKFGPSSKDLASFIKANKPRTGFWNNFDKYIVSQLRAFYGDAATKENDFGFNWLHRRHCDSCVARKPPPPFRPLYQPPASAVPPQFWNSSVFTSPPRRSWDSLPPPSKPSSASSSNCATAACTHRSTTENLAGPCASPARSKAPSHYSFASFGTPRPAAATLRRYASWSVLSPAATHGYGLDARRRTIPRRCLKISANHSWNLFQVLVPSSLRSGAGGDFENLVPLFRVDRGHLGIVGRLQQARF